MELTVFRASKRGKKPRRVNVETLEDLKGIVERVRKPVLLYVPEILDDGCSFYWALEIDDVNW
jgi:hypothetical protein